MVLAALSLVAWTSVAVGAGSPPPAEPQGLTTGIFDPLTTSLTSVAEYRRMAATGATSTRLLAPWSAIAPSSRPTDAKAEDPGNAGYDWTQLDGEVKAATAAGLDPIVDIVGIPGWALQPGTSGPGTPKAADLGRFATAAARRYSGSYHGLPRVREWQVWNEPNLMPDLSPQLVGGKPVSPDAYRKMVNAVASAVKAVSPANVVVAGGLAPFRDVTPSVYAQNKEWGPLAFMRAFFCLSPTLKPTCNAKVRLDVWSMHPYTSGGPTHHADFPNDVSLPDLPKADAILRAATRAGHIVPARLPQLWVTEFSWDSDPPDPAAVPVALLMRWVPQALYQMWRERVSLVTWFLLDDQPMKTSIYQSGFYTADGAAKPYIEGFRFPVVAFRRPGGFYVWGRTPAGKPGSVIVEQRSTGSWRRIAALKTDPSGIFEATLRAARTGFVRAELTRGGERSLPFSLTPVPDHPYQPFGLR